MVNSLSGPHTAAALDGKPEVVRPAACPMCHTPASLTQGALEAGGAWRCTRCGQRWDAARLAAVVRYAAWIAERERADRRGTEQSQTVTQYRDPATTPMDGTP